jgi:hypothetical protein
MADMTCLVKNTYESSYLAREALKKIKERQRKGTMLDPCAANRAFYCEGHKGWHLTKQEINRPACSTDIMPGTY